MRLFVFLLVSSMGFAFDEGPFEHSVTGAARPVQILEPLAAFPNLSVSNGVLYAKDSGVWKPVQTIGYQQFLTVGGAPIADTESRKQAAMFYLDGFKNGKYDRGNLFVVQEFLNGEGFFQNPEEALLKEDKAFLRAIRRYSHGGRKPQSIQGVMDPTLCAGSKLFANLMADAQTNYPSGGAHYGLSSAWNYEGQSYPSRFSMGLRRGGVSEGAEISSRTWDDTDLDAYATALFEGQKFAALTEDEKLEVQGWACIEGWRKFGSGHFASFMRPHKRYCFSLSRSQKTNNVFCNGLFTD